MSRVVYVNNCYLPYRDASVHVEDRGFQFADGVYEVCEIAKGYLVDGTRHLDRLDRSMRELYMHPPMGRPALIQVIHEVIRRNRVRDGLVYIQITRGVAKRDFALPSGNVAPTLVVMARHASRAASEAKAASGIAVRTMPENRWPRVDIKSTALLANVLAKHEAQQAGAAEVWYVDRDGFVTEGGSSNAWIVTQDGRLVTRPAKSGILRGVTRRGVIDLARRRGLALEERSFTVEEACQAKEAFITAATNLVMPVVRIDGQSIGNGYPGFISADLRRQFHEEVERVPV